MLLKLIWVFVLMSMVVAISTVVSAAVANMSGLAKKMMPRMKHKMCESEMEEPEAAPYE